MLDDQAARARNVHIRAARRKAQLTQAARTLQAILRDYRAKRVTLAQTLARLDLLAEDMLKAE